MKIAKSVFRQMGVYLNRVIVTVQIVILLAVALILTAFMSMAFWLF